MRRQFLVLILSVVVIVGLEVARQASRLVQSFAGPARALDGDTLVMDGRRLRLEGLDAPEWDQTCGKADEIACGRRARGALARLLAGGVTCRSTSHDRYGRPLVSCRMQDGRDLAEAMVGLGEAIDTGCCAAAEAGAQAARRGLWAAPFIAPSDWRQQHPTQR